MYPQCSVSNSIWAINMIQRMSDRSSEVRMKHALAGTEGHSHLVISVNYKWGRPATGEDELDSCLSRHTYKWDHSPYAWSAPLSARSRGPVVAEKRSAAARWNWGKVHNHSCQTVFHSLFLRFFFLIAFQGNTRWGELYVPRICLQ